MTCSSRRGTARAWGAGGCLLQRRLGLEYTGSGGGGTNVRAVDVVAPDTVRLRNTGFRPGRDVVQIYVRPADDQPDRPVRWLAGLATVEAAAGQSGSCHQISGTPPWLTSPNRPGSRKATLRHSRWCISRFCSGWHTRGAQVETLGRPR